MMKKVYRSMDDFLDDAERAIELARFLKGSTKRRKRRKRRIVQSIMRPKRCLVLPKNIKVVVSPYALEPEPPNETSKTR